MEELTFHTLIAVFEEIFGAACSGPWSPRRSGDAGLDLRPDPRPKPRDAPVPGRAALHAGGGGAGRLVRHGDDRQPPCRYRRAGRRHRLARHCRHGRRRRRNPRLYRREAAVSAWSADAGLSSRLASRVVDHCARRNSCAHAGRRALHPCRLEYCDASLDGSFSAWNQTGRRVGPTVYGFEMGKSEHHMSGQHRSVNMSYVQNGATLQYQA
jgi:hypothetical protein